MDEFILFISGLEISSADLDKAVLFISGLEISSADLDKVVLFISGLEISSADLDKVVLLKNRAAVYLKTKNYEQVVKVHFLNPSSLDTIVWFNCQFLAMIF